jgi:hypothetical protein
MLLHQLYAEIKGKGSLPHTLQAQHARLTGMRTKRLWTSSETTEASNMGAREYPKTHCSSATRFAKKTLAYQTLKERPEYQHMVTDKPVDVHFASK